MKTESNWIGNVRPVPYGVIVVSTIDATSEYSCGLHKYRKLYILHGKIL